MATLGARIKARRKEKKLTQAQLGELTGKSMRMIQKYESGEVTPSFDQLKKIAAVLDIKVVEFVMDAPREKIQEHLENQKAIQNYVQNRNNELFVIAAICEMLGFRVDRKTASDSWYITDSHGKHFELMSYLVNNISDQIYDYANYKLTNVLKDSDAVPDDEYEAEKVPDEAYKYRLTWRETFSQEQEP